MLEHINNLKDEEKDIIIHSPLYVSLLIAGADGEVNDTEKKRILELIHTKTFSEKYELRDLYKTLDHDAAHELRELISVLPQEKSERNEFLIQKLSRLNHIFPKLEHRFQVQLYKSLRQFAHYIAHAEGGFWSVGAVKHAEQEYLKLPMIHDPEEDSEE
ncbi:MAG: hypothetical protein KG003_10625 [Bacteroidetes bacterium]|nr:hypothetical protein [Bacteroidota bacterium]